MDTNLQGRLMNTSLGTTHGLLPLFEAVVNSIHAIEENNTSTSEGRITVEIVRGTQGQLDLSDESGSDVDSMREPIQGFKIIDNGIGFNDENMKSFRTLDTDHKAEKGCRGIGRLLWLKAFKRVEITSTFFVDTKTLKKRTFNFTASNGISNEQIVEVAEGSSACTAVYLQHFAKKYERSSRKTVQAIADSLFEHCLWYFVRDGGAPTIELIDGEESISLDDVYEGHMASTAKTEQITIKNEVFSLTHVRLTATPRSHAMALCAASRLVDEETLVGRVPGLFGKLSDGKNEFSYLCYVASSFLDEAVRAERTGFNLAEESGELFENFEISKSDIRNSVIERVKVHLHDFLTANFMKSRQRVDDFVATKAPRYRPILSRLTDEKLGIDPAIQDKELELFLHKQLAEIESQLLSEGHDLMSPKKGEEYVDYNKRLEDYLKKAEEIKKSDLANYVFHRKVILDLLSKAIERDASGKYSREELIHRLIMPMRVDSSEVRPEDCNLWLIDERLAFHHYLSSDKTLASIPVTGSSDTKEPDLFGLNVYDNPLLVSEGKKLPLASIVVVEIKRPMRNDAAQGEEKDPIEQALDYLDRIRHGEVTTKDGRPVPNSQDIPGFCYILCDLTPTIRKRCRMHDAVVTSDKMGYFFYKKEIGAYVEVISFDRLVNSARERNRAFFDRLGLPAT